MFKLCNFSHLQLYKTKSHIGYLVVSILQHCTVHGICGLVKQNYTKCTVFGLVWHITRRGKYNMAYGKVRQKYTGCIACVVIRQNYTTRMVGPYMAWLNLKTKRAAQFIMV